MDCLKWLHTFVGECERTRERSRTTAAAHTGKGKLDGTPTCLDVGFSACDMRVLEFVIR